MSKKLYEEDSIKAIADAIREKTGSTDTMTVADMATNISSISGGTKEYFLSIKGSTQIAQTYNKPYLQATGAGRVTVLINRYPEDSSTWYGQGFSTENIGAEETVNMFTLPKGAQSVHFACSDLTAYINAYVFMKNPKDTWTTSYRLENGFIGDGSTGCDSTLDVSSFTKDDEAYIGFTIKTETATDVYKLPSSVFTLEVDGVSFVDIANGTPYTKFLNNLSVTAVQSKELYKDGDSENVRKVLTVTAEYTDGTSEIVTDYEVDGPDTSTIGVTTCIVTYKELSKTAYVYISA